MMQPPNRAPLARQIAAIEGVLNGRTVTRADLRAVRHTLQSAKHWRALIVECGAEPSLSPEERTLFDAVGE